MSENRPIAAGFARRRSRAFEPAVDTDMLVRFRFAAKTPGRCRPSREETTLREETILIEF
jgi:hypothetical protein